MNQYREGPKSTVTHHGREYRVDDLLAVVSSHRLVQMPISKVEWILEETQVEPERVENADIDYPIIVIHERNQYIVLDGAHRLTKAKRLGEHTIAAKVIVPAELPEPVA